MALDKHPYPKAGHNHVGRLHKIIILSQVVSCMVIRKDTREVVTKESPFFNLRP